MQRGKLYTVLFAAGVCGVFSIAVSLSAVSLKDLQEQNKVLDRQSNVLRVSGLVKPGEELTADKIQKLFDENIETRVVDLATGEYAPESINPKDFDMEKAMSDPEASTKAPENKAKVLRVPKYGLVYVVKKAGKLDSVVFPIQGKGLWSTLYGYMALESDINTIKGITFYQDGETPGLGGEINNPNWKALWVGRKAYDDQGSPKIEVIKGVAGPVEQAPFNVDGMSGATITSRSVTFLVQFWLGANGFGPFLKNLRDKSGS